MRIALVTDAWAPQVNGVVRTLTETVSRLRTRGHEMLVLEPSLFRTLPCPSYPEIRLALGAGREVARRLARFAPDALHVATEGPLGWAARAWARREERPFTTAFHTRFPDYLAVRTGLSEEWFWPAMRRFHAAAAHTFVATPSLAAELRGRGLTRTHLWSRGVDLALFTPDAPPPPEYAALPRPILLYVGRVASEKNVGAFLAADLPGSKVVVGDGPARVALAREFPAARFVGPRFGRELAGYYAGADCFVFPSRTDTFGLVMIEALACGTPVAALPAPGPLDIVGQQGRGRNGRPVGALAPDLAAAVAQALQCSRDDCAAEGRSYDWNVAVDQFEAGLAQRNATAIAAEVLAG